MDNAYEAHEYRLDCDFAVELFFDRLAKQYEDDSFAERMDILGESLSERMGGVESIKKSPLHMMAMAFVLGLNTGLELAEGATPGK